MPEKLRRAVNDTDSAAIVSLRRRSDEIDTYITAANLKFNRLRLLRAQEQMVELQAQIPALAEANEKAGAHLHEASVMKNKAMAALKIARGQVRDLNQSIGATKITIEQLSGELTPRADAPVTRLVRTQVLTGRL